MNTLTKFSCYRIYLLKIYVIWAQVVGIILALYWESCNSNSNKFRIMIDNNKIIMIIIIIKMVMKWILAYNKFSYNKTKQTIIIAMELLAAKTIPHTIVHYLWSCNKIPNVREALIEIHLKIIIIIIIKWIKIAIVMLLFRLIYNNLIKVSIIDCRMVMVRAGLLETTEVKKVIHLSRESIWIDHWI